MQIFYINSSIDSESYVKEFKTYKQCLKWVKTLEDKQWTITV